MLNKSQFSKIKNFAEIQNLSGRDFEWFTKFLLEHVGHEKVKVTSYQKDGGVDSISFFADKKHYTQAKNWKKTRNGKDYLPVKEIRELGGAMLRDKVTRGVFVTTLLTYPNAKEEASLMNIMIVDRVGINTIMKEINPNYSKEPSINIFNLLNFNARFLKPALITIILIILIIAKYVSGV